jgi:hypothetical protein
MSFSNVSRTDAALESFLEYVHRQAVGGEREAAELQNLVRRLWHLLSPEQAHDVTRTMTANTAVTVSVEATPGWQGTLGGFGTEELEAWQSHPSQS